jgi:hypothetical protein
MFICSNIPARVVSKSIEARLLSIPEARGSTTMKMNFCLSVVETDTVGVLPIFTVPVTGSGFGMAGIVGGFATVTLP